MPGLACRQLGATRQVTLFATPPRFDDEAGIVSLADRLWLVGQVRLDARDELLRHLDLPAEATARPGGDARLCLAAYARWGEACVDRLAGDVAFVLWDEERQVLFAVRDHVGKRCLFHARRGGLGAIGDDLDWVAAQAAPDRAPDDYWITDFLALNCCREFERTAYRDVSRLAPAHLLRWDRHGATGRRYWRLEVGEPLSLPRRADYRERFRDITMRAVADRAGSARVGIAMSGGLDSTTLAACAVRQAGDPERVVAYCEHYETMMHIEEDVYAGMAARHLGIDLEIVPLDDVVYDPHWQRRGIRTPEPQLSILQAHHLRTFGTRLAARAPVWFEGEGPDNALRFDRDPYLRWLRGRGDWRAYAAALASYVAAKGVTGWLETLRRHAAPAPPAVDDGATSDIPTWMDRDLVRQLRLEERAADLGDGGDRSHPWHPEAMAALTKPIWSAHFSEYAFEEAQSAVQWRHPFMDIRVIQFLASVPPIPWAWKKKLVREAMAGWLPEPVLRRPKTPLAVFPQAVALQRHGPPPVLAPHRLKRWVDVARLPTAGGDADGLARSLGAYVLDHWLATLSDLP